jgi:periplasmic protein TonB
MTSPTKARPRGRVFGAPISSGHPTAGIDSRATRLQPPREDARQTSRETDVIDASAPVAATERATAPTRAAEPLEPPAKPVFIDSMELVQTVLVEPVYPAAAMRAAQEGWVTLEFTVGERGDVRDALITDAEPAGVFDAAALKAVGQWRFKPRVSNGRPVPVRSSATLRFAVDR